jgi:hypothetical protein
MAISLDEKECDGITFVDDNRLIQLISDATRRLVYMAPGLSEGVAEALAEKWRRLGPKSVTVVLDVDPEVCRLGFGTLKGLEKVSAAARELGAEVRQQPGLRIGVVISDDITIVYSPIPLLIERGPQSEGRNAIRLNSAPMKIMEQVGLGANPASEQTVGKERITEQHIDAVKKDLDRAPPMKFDLARRVRVFNNYFQYAELELKGCRLSRKRVRIPADLVGLARNPEVSSKLQAFFNLIGEAPLAVKDGDKIITQKSLEDKRNDIARQFLIPLKGFGSIVRREKKEELQKAVSELEREVKKFRDKVVSAVEETIHRNKDALVEALLPSVAANPPACYTKYYGPSIPDAQLRTLLAKDIERAFGDAKSLVMGMKVSLVFKDIAYDSLKDEEFIKAMRDALPQVEIEKIYEEYEATPAQQSGRW